MKKAVLGLAGLVLLSAGLLGGIWLLQRHRCFYNCTNPMVNELIDLHVLVGVLSGMALPCGAVFLIFLLRGEKSDHKKSKGIST